MFDDEGATIKESLLEPLFTALSEPEAAVRSGALRLLVRLPLPDQAWYRLAERVEKELALYLLPETATKAQFPFEELLDAAMRIPISTVRRSLYEFLGNERPPTLRQQVVRTLARAGDRTAIDFQDTPWEGDLDELVDQLMGDSEAGWEVLPQLSPAQKASLISAWFAVLEKPTARDAQSGEFPAYSGSGNQIMELPGWFWQGFEPDLAQLFDIYLLLAPERTELMEQLAWVISRAGKSRLINEYLPLLPMLEADEKASMLQLLERAVSSSAQTYGPTYGAGPAILETLPVIRPFIDYESADIGGEQAPLTLSDEEKQAPRYVQGEVYDNSDKQTPQKLERAFLAGKEHLLKVWIDELKAGAIAAPLPIDLGQLPNLPSWDLQVYFWEPNHAPEVQLGKLTVYQEQLADLPISTCEFTFTPRLDLPNFQGRLAVVYQKNVLQMLFLEGKVLAEATPASESDQIHFEWAEVKGLRRPDQLQEFDLTFYHDNDTVQGAGLMFFGGQAGLKRVSGLDQGIQDMISALQEAGAPGEVSLEAKKEELVILANQGSMLYSAILEQIGTDNQALLHLREVQRLQLVSAVRDVFPLELVYVYPPPNPDAELCPNAQQAIQTGACFTCDSLNEEEAAKVICPLGFLGMRCIIERHAIQPLQQSEAALEDKDYQLFTGFTTGRKTIDPFKSSLCATSAKVEPGNKQKLTTTLESLYPNACEFAVNWNDWKEKIKTKAPSALVLIPHTLKDYNIPTLEIGNSKLWKTGINQTVVGASGEVRPLVLLIGCETAVPEAPYQGFAAAFSQAGAAITVMTLSPIHESHAAPITEILVRQFHQSAQYQQTFSEALLQARRTAMAGGYAEALTLVADGDADWVLIEE